MNYHYRDKAGREIGPLNLDTLAKLRFAKVIDGDTPVRAENSSEWKPCRELIADGPSVTPTPPSTGAGPGRTGWSQYGWSLFAFAALCFLLPFFDVSCQGQKVLTMTGKQLVTGIEVDQPSNPWSSEKKQQTIQPEQAAQWALGLAAAALLLALGRKQATRILSALVGVAGVAALLVLKSKIEAELSAQTQAQMRLEIGFKEGFWLAGVLLLCGALGQAKAFDQSRKERARRGAAPWKPTKRQVAVAISILAAVGVVYGGLILHRSLLAKTNLSFEFLIDGKPLGTGANPEVTVDGKQFSNGGAIGLGKHHIRVRLADAEFFERSFWVFYGANNLGSLPLESSKGTLVINVNPLPANVTIKRKGEKVLEGGAPLTAKNLPVGDYMLSISKGKYEEEHPARILRQQTTEERIDLELGTLNLSAIPPNAEYELTGAGGKWQGALPALVADVPAGRYQFTARRKGWELIADVVATRGVTTTNRAEFPYGAIELTSEPSGLTVSTNGVAAGKTPLTIDEVRPGAYTLSATDGENEVRAQVTLGPKENLKHTFSFRYGSVRLASTPPGATVIRNGKEIGKTPVTLQKIPAGDASVELELAGYARTNYALNVRPDETADLNVKLTDERYLGALQAARTNLQQGQFADALKFVDSALGIQPQDPGALALQNEIVKAQQSASEALKQKQQNDLLELIGKAIEAKGGAAVLSRWKVSKTISTVTTMNNGKPQDVRMTAYVQQPAQLKVIEEVLNPEGVVTYCIAGSGTWMRKKTALGTESMSISPPAKKSLENMLYLDYCSDLQPLTHGDFHLAPADSAKDLPGSIGIKVSKEGKPDVTLFFDRNSNRLLGKDYDEPDDNGGQRRMSLRESDFRNFSGVICPMVTRVLQDGVLKQEIKTEQVAFSEAFPEGLFDAPAGEGQPTTASTTSLDSLCANIPYANAFLNYDSEMHFEFQKVWDALTTVLKEQKETIKQQDLQAGTIMTDLTRHGIIGFPHHDMYCVVLERKGEASAIVHLKLLSFWVDFGGTRGPRGAAVPEEKDVVKKRVQSFVDKVEAKLKKP